MFCTNSTALETIGILVDLTTESSNLDSIMGSANTTNTVSSALAIPIGTVERL